MGYSSEIGVKVDELIDVLTEWGENYTETYAAS
jgi:hypothetical protein